MTYTYQQVDARFFLPRRHHAAALSEIKRLCGLSDSERTPGLTTLSEAFHNLRAFTWSVDMDLAGNITGLDLHYGSNWRHESTTQIFAAIAPFVEAGSYIRIRGEEGEEWRWEFDGQRLHTITHDGKERENTLHAPGDYRLESPTAYSFLDINESMIQDWLRSRAVEILGTLGEAAPLPLLIGLLNEAGPVGTQARLALKPSSRQVPISVIEQVLNSADWNAWQAGMEMLQSRGDEEALNLLVDRTRQGHDGWLLHHDFRQNDAFPEEKLIPLLEDENGYVRCMALQLPGRHTPLASLLRALQDKHDEGQAVNPPRIALQILLKYAEPLPVDPFVALLDHRDSYISHLAATILKNQGQRVPVKVLMQALESTSDAFLRGLLIEALDAFGAQAPIDQIVDILLSQHVYFTVVRTRDEPYEHEHVNLPGISPYLPIARLRHLAQHGDGWTRWRALHLCGRMGAYAPVDLLVEMALHGENRTAAIEALSILGEHAPLDVMLRLVDDSSYALRLTAVRGLRNMGARVPLTVWSKLAHHFDGSVRGAAIAALKGSDDPAAIAALLSALGDPCTENREAAIGALTEVVEHIPVKSVISMLCVDSAWQRAAALKIAAMLGERVPIAALKKAYVYLSGKVAALGQASDTPIDLLLEVEDEWLAPLRFTIMRRQGERAPGEPLLAALGDLRAATYRQALETLPYHPEAQRIIAAEAEALLRDGVIGRYLGSFAQSYRIASLDTGQPLTQQIWDEVTAALDWHYWPVRVEALRSIARLRHAIPRPIIKRVLALQHDPSSAAVRLAALLAYTAPTP
jgi:HEAT repeat protein